MSSPAQVAGATMWVNQAMEGTDTKSLLEQKIVLFEQCSFDDEGDTCKELTAALGELQTVMSRIRQDMTPVSKTVTSLSRTGFGKGMCFWLRFFLGCL